MNDSSDSQMRNRPERCRPALLTQPLTGSDLHIWYVSLESFLQELTDFADLLSPDEKMRAERFYFEKDHSRYIIGRGLLKHLLGGYLGLEASTIQFTYGVHGKPALTSQINGRSLEFNLSHSNDMAVYIFNWDQPVGIDVEYIHPMKDMDDFALQFFTPNECKLIHSLSKDQKQASFFKIWTCKEAFLKANGSGLTTPINQVEVSLTPEGTANLTSIGNNREQASSWRLEMFNPNKGYQASLAIKGYGKRSTFQQLDRL